MSETHTAEAPPIRLPWIPCEPAKAVMLLGNIWNAKRGSLLDADSKAGIDAALPHELAPHELPRDDSSLLTHADLQGRLQRDAPHGWYVQERPGGYPVLLVLQTVEGRMCMFLLVCSGGTLGVGTGDGAAEAAAATASASAATVSESRLAASAVAAPAVCRFSSQFFVPRQPHTAHAQTDELYKGTILMGTLTSSTLYVYDVAAVANAPLAGVSRYSNRIAKLPLIVAHVASVSERVMGLRTCVCRSELVGSAGCEWAHWRSETPENACAGLWLIAGDELLQPPLPAPSTRRFVTPRFHFVNLFRVWGTWMFKDVSMVTLNKLPLGVYTCMKVCTEQGHAATDNAVYRCFLTSDASLYPAFGLEGTGRAGVPAGTGSRKYVYACVVVQIVRVEKSTPLPHIDVDQETSTRVDIERAVARMDACATQQDLLAWCSHAEPSKLS